MQNLFQTLVVGGGIIGGIEWILSFITLALIGYPAVRYLQMPGDHPAATDPIGDMMLAPSSADLRADPTLRGGEMPPPRTLVLAELGPILDLKLRSEAPPSATERYHLRVSDGTRLLSEHVDFRDTTASSFRVLLHTDRLATGLITIGISRYDRTGGRKMGEETFRLLLQ